MSCVGWLGGRSAAQRAQERLQDSDDEVEATTLYLDEDADGSTKVAQLSAGPTLPAAAFAVRAAHASRAQAASYVSIQCDSYFWQYRHEYLEDASSCVGPFRQASSHVCSQAAAAGQCSARQPWLRAALKPRQPH